MPNASLLSDSTESIPVDLSLLEFNLSLTPLERIDAHESARELVIELQNAGNNYYEARFKGSSQKAYSK
jgi:hypothetical protein